MKTQDYWVRHEHGGDRLSLEDARALPRLPLLGILDNIRSAHNVGSMFRTCDGVGASGLWLCGYTPCPPHRHLAKTALNAVEVVPWQHFETIEEAIAQAKRDGWQVLAMEGTTGSIGLWECELKFPVALVMGNEAEGLSEETRALCDATIHLPMCGLKSSLNVSVAFGAATYEILRRHEIRRE